MVGVIRTAVSKVILRLDMDFILQILKEAGVKRSWSHSLLLFVGMRVSFCFPHLELWGDDVLNVDKTFYEQKVDIWFWVNNNGGITTSQKLCENQKQKISDFLCFFIITIKKSVFIKQGTLSYKKLNDRLLPSDVDISQNIEGKNIFFNAVLCPSPALLCICLLSPLELNAFIIIWWGKHTRERGISLYFQNLSCLSSTIKPSANFLPQPWMINTLSCNVLLMSHRNHTSPISGVSLL